MTAVEWLAEMVFNKEDLPDFVLGMVINQAKEMEKEQIKDAYYKGGDDLTKMHFIESEQYYNKTFKQQEQ